MVPENVKQCEIWKNLKKEIENSKKLKSAVSVRMHFCSLCGMIGSCRSTVIAHIERTDLHKHDNLFARTPKVRMIEPTPMDLVVETKDASDGKSEIQELENEMLVRITNLNSPLNGLQGALVRRNNGFQMTTDRWKVKIDSRQKMTDEARDFLIVNNYNFNIGAGNLTVLVRIYNFWKTILHTN